MRLLLPLAFGMLVVVPPQPYFELRQAGAIQPGYGEFLERGGWVNEEPVREQPAVESETRPAMSRKALKRERSRIINAGDGMHAHPTQALADLLRHLALPALVLGMAAGGVWVKDETGNVSGSHKARHLMGIMLWIHVVERLGATAPSAAAGPRLAIASCGNAALAAAISTGLRPRRRTPDSSREPTPSMCSN